MEKFKDLFYQNLYDGFDYYNTEFDFLHRNWDEKLLSLEDYGITKEDVYNYQKIVERERHRHNTQRKIYANRLKVVNYIIIIAEILFFFYFVGHFNDFMREHDVFYDILLYPVYIGLILCLIFLVYPFLTTCAAAYTEHLLNVHDFPCEYGNMYGPKGFQGFVGGESDKTRRKAQRNNGIYIDVPIHWQHVEKYFNDLLWEIHKKNLTEPGSTYSYIKKPENWDTNEGKTIIEYLKHLDTICDKLLGKAKK